MTNKIYLVRSIYGPDQTNLQLSIVNMNFPTPNLVVGWINPHLTYPSIKWPNANPPYLMSYNFGKLYQLKVSIEYLTSIEYNTQCSPPFLWWLDHDIKVPTDTVDASFWTYLPFQQANYGIFYLHQTGTDTRIPANFQHLPLSDQIGNQPVAVIKDSYNQQQTAGASFVLTPRGVQALQMYFNLHPQLPLGYINEEIIINTWLSQQGLQIAYLPNLTVEHSIRILAN